MRKIVTLILIALASVNLAWAGARVSVSWEASNSTDVAGYNVYVNGQQEQHITVPTATSWLGDCPDCVEGENVVGVTAFDSAGQESEMDVRTVDFDPPPNAPHITSATIME